MVTDLRVRSKSAGSVEIVVLLFATLAAFSQGEIQTTRTCHWCGPLAEQVHRSRRAPPCSSAAPDHTTLCDPGLTYCATVATAPPQVISRYCVKLYQDDCYPLFCNTTQTWKVTCPCQGDFCNGDIGEREREAFAMLAKLVAKTKKKNKRNISTIVTENNGMRINETHENQEHTSGDYDNTYNIKNTTSKDNDKFNNKENMPATEASKIDNENEANMDNAISVSTENIGNSEGNQVPIGQNTTVNLDVKDETEINAITQSITDETIKQMDNAVNAVDNVQDEINSARDNDSIENEVVKEIKSEIEDKGGVNPPMEPQMQTPMLPEPTILTTVLEAKLSINNEETKQSISNMKPTEKLPPSESLQQNETPKADKITTTEVPTTEESTTVSTLQTTTTMKSKMRKNKAKRNNLNFMVFLFSSITSYFLF